VTGKTDYTANEVMNLLPQVVNGVTWWYGIHSVYNVPQSGAGSSLEDYTKRWEFAMAPGTATTGPMALASATPQFLGQSINTYPQYWPITATPIPNDLTRSCCHGAITRRTQAKAVALALDWYAKITACVSACTLRSRNLSRMRPS